MKSHRVLVQYSIFSLLFLASTFAWAQTSRPLPSIGAVVQGYHYDPVKGVLTLNVLNTSQKDITAIAFDIAATYPDGDADSRVLGTDLLGGMISTVERGHANEPTGGNGTFEAGAFRDFEFPQGTPIANVKATVGVVIYADGSAGVLNKAAFQRMVLQRKAGVLAMQKADKLLAEALADGNDEHPAARVAAQLEGLAKSLSNSPLSRPDDASSYEGLRFREIAQDLRNAPQSSAGRSANEDDYLRTVIKVHENRISLTLPHTVITQEVQ